MRPRLALCRVVQIPRSRLCFLFFSKKGGRGEEWKTESQACEKKWNCGGVYSQIGILAQVLPVCVSALGVQTKLPSIDLRTIVDSDSSVKMEMGWIWVVSRLFLCQVKEAKSRLQQRVSTAVCRSAEGQEGGGGKKEEGNSWPLYALL